MLKLHLNRRIKALTRIIFSRATKRILVIGLGIFLIVNCVLALIFWHRTYPGTTVSNQNMSNINHGELNGHLQKLTLLPKLVQLHTKDKALNVPVSDLGLSIDQKSIVQSLKSQKSWLPIINLFKPPSHALKLKVDEPKFSDKANKLANELKRDALNAQIAFSDGKFVIKAEQDGYHITAKELKNVVLTELGKGNSTVILPTKTLYPSVKQASLASGLSKLQTQQKTSVVFRYQDKVNKPSEQDIGLWFDQNGSSYIVSDNKIQAYIISIGSSFGMQVQNLTQAVRATSDGLRDSKSVDFTLIAVPPPIKSYRYCVTTRGVDASFLPEFKTKLQAVFHDSRGWWLGGQVSLTEAQNGCNMTVWLSAADQITSFGAICDPAWSCTVSPNVIINFDRWRYASTAWNGSGGSLDDYRSMVINHETGHWFGFGHQNCGGAGQLAPVMQQQSINLQGCNFNPWPLTSELASLKTRLGL